VVKLTLEEWDAMIGSHLHKIEAGAELCERHARQLVGVPDFPLRVMDRLDMAEAVMRNALLLIAKARTELRSKIHVG
jgi:hypothetical protein